MSDATRPVRYNGKAGSTVKNRYGVWSTLPLQDGEEWKSPVKDLTDRQIATLPADLFEVEGKAKRKPKKQKSE